MDLLDLFSFLLSDLFFVTLLGRLCEIFPMLLLDLIFFNDLYIFIVVHRLLVFFYLCTTSTLASFLFPTCTASCAVWRSRMKVVAAAGGRVAIKYAATGRSRTRGQETGCQINQRGEMCHLLCDSPGLGGRRPKV